ncbi:hypothetical protein [Pseudorhizobium pelagicum]|uniref:hypothetical protein n=1 Tax=Pseudorhizobium pelagicum TaxID=1509405 RepID=UPI001300C3FB|nr:hypothetical protein [Pseudorhizobium pelagicum]
MEDLVLAGRMLSDSGPTANADAWYGSPEFAKAAVTHALKGYEPTTRGVTSYLLDLSKR